MFVNWCWVGWIIVKVNIWVEGFQNFHTKSYFLSIFTSIGIEFHFPLACPLLFCKSLFRSFLETLTPWTTEIREVSPANNSHSILSLIDKSFMYIRNKRGPRIEPWGTPEFQPKKSTDHLKQLLAFNYLKIISPQIPFWRNLKSNTSCKILSSVFEKSMNIPLTSSPISNVTKISWSVDRIWLIQESLGLNPDWFRKDRLFYVRSFIILL